jgi:hypothetical protein
MTVASHDARQLIKAEILYFLHIPFMIVFCGITLLLRRLGRIFPCYVSEKKKKSVPSFEAAKYKFTLVLGDNANRVQQMEPLMVHQSAKYHTLQRYMKYLLPVHVYSNANG